MFTSIFLPRATCSAVGVECFFCWLHKKSSLLQQAKRWLTNKWTDWQTLYLPLGKYSVLVRKKTPKAPFSVAKPGFLDTKPA
jgi:hypothetical protein